MTIKSPFQPRYGSNQVLTAAAASATAALPRGNKQVRIVNTGANLGYVRIGTGAQVASAADYPIAPGASSIVTKADDDDTIAYISATGTTLQVMTGEGW